MKTPDLTDKINRNIYKGVQQGILNESDLVQILELCGNLLNLQTISDYARESGLSYNGVKNHRNVKEIFGVKFVIETF